MASHEFRTPLSTILSSVSLIEKYKEEEYAEKRTKHVNRIKSSVNNLTGILNDFLSISKLEEGKQGFSTSEIQTVEFFRSIAEDMQAIAKNDQKIIYEHQGNDGIIVLDPQVIRNILINLVSNSIKYSSEGMKIMITSKFEADYLVFEITDFGIGIPEEEQEHLFERFFRAKNVTNIQGTGLGLNIVKKYVELLKGSIMFTSKPNIETTFTVTLPKKI